MGKYNNQENLQSTDFRLLEVSVDVIPGYQHEIVDPSHFGIIDEYHAHPLKPESIAPEIRDKMPAKTDECVIKIRLINTNMSGTFSASDIDTLMNYVLKSFSLMEAT